MSKNTPLKIVADEVESELEERGFDWQPAAHPRKLMYAGDDIPMAWRMPRIKLKDKREKDKK